MIQEIRNKKPFLHFGFNRQTITAYKGEKIILWQDTIYQKSTPLGKVTATGSTILTQNNNKIELEYVGVGSFSVKVEINKIESDILNIDIQERTFGATDIFWGDTIITFND